VTHRISTLLFSDFIGDFLSFNTDVITPTESNKRNNFEKNFGSGSIIQCTAPRINIVDNHFLYRYGTIFGCDEFLAVKITLVKIVVETSTINILNLHVVIINFLISCQSDKILKCLK
jgi:hypothetical protein